MVEFMPKPSPCIGCIIAHIECRYERSQLQYHKSAQCVYVWAHVGLGEGVEEKGLGRRLGRIGVRSGS